jgi:hypothetical protein
MRHQRQNTAAVAKSGLTALTYTLHDLWLLARAGSDELFPM